MLSEQKVHNVFLNISKKRAAYHLGRLH